MRGRSLMEGKSIEKAGQHLLSFSLARGQFLQSVACLTFSMLPSHPESQSVFSQSSLYLQPPHFARRHPGGASWKTSISRSENWGQTLHRVTKPLSTNFSNLSGRSKVIPRPLKRCPRAKRPMLGDDNNIDRRESKYDAAA